jgi:TetR/AcrR family transcriptional regulator
MASRRRLGDKDSTTHSAILDAAAKVLLEEGVTRFTARRISQKAGIKSQLVHYYFRTMEDLIVTLLRRGGDEVIRSLARAAASGEPLQALWKLELESRSSALIAGLVSLAARRERVRAEAIRYAEVGRGMQAEAIASHLELRGIEPPISPLAIAFHMSAVARQLADEQARGMSLGHREAAAAIENWILKITAETRHVPSRNRATASTRRSRPARR